VKKTIAVGAAGLGAGVAVLSGAPAFADSPTITASNGQCEAKWFSANPVDTFRIRDDDLNDSDFCYVDFSFSSESGVNASGHGRVQVGQDVGGFHNFGVGNGGSKTVWWKVCKERQNDPDICSSIRSDAT